MKYILTKYDDKKFASGDTIRMYPVKRIELTEKELEEIQFSIELKDKEISEGNENKINKKLREVLE